MKKWILILTALIAFGLVFTGPALGDGKVSVGKAQKVLSKKININKADAETLQQLKGIGPKLADKIIAYRDAHKKFKSVEELMEVSGIGEKVFKAIKPFITVK